MTNTEILVAQRYLAEADQYLLNKKSGEAKFFAEIAYEQLALTVDYSLISMAKAIIATCDCMFEEETLEKLAKKGVLSNDITLKALIEEHSESYRAYGSIKSFYEHVKGLGSDACARIQADQNQLSDDLTYLISNRREIDEWTSGKPSVFDEERCYKTVDRIMGQDPSKMFESGWANLAQKLQQIKDSKTQ